MKTPADIAIERRERYFRERTDWIWKCAEEITPRADYFGPFRMKNQTEWLMEVERNANAIARFALNDKQREVAALEISREARKFSGLSPSRILEIWDAATYSAAARSHSKQEGGA